jgi:hypothetical protein
MTMDQTPFSKGKIIYYKKTSFFLLRHDVETTGSGSWAAF